MKTGPYEKRFCIFTQFAIFAVCLLASEDEIDTSVATATCELPSHLEFLHDSQIINRPDKSESHSSVSNRTERSCSLQSCFVFRASCISALGGVLFGYDVGKHVLFIKLCCIV